ncbi:outer membrane porin GjpA [Mycobacterium sp. M1]|uniref:Outer membrane porin GjpA n=1 Tax=Mycolicibacter acidiphilus TaxID=2835306 RepID=A0ABS5RIM1_9MYCO|nr:outer membrane porin GjpA [Mycolicibacter acidiphilus]MBS9534142.1 outer membrane porin GjpA [Mycolicibacter acidiphilus]
MQNVSRPYVAAGIALVAAGMVAVTPVALGSLDAHVTHDVALTADLDFTGAWEQAIDTAKANQAILSGAADEVSKAFSEALKANPDALADHGKDLLNDLTFQGFGDLEGADVTTYLRQHVTPLAQHVLDKGHGTFFSVLNGTNPLGHTFGIDPLEGDNLSLLTFAGSPMSGVLLGALSPSIAPIVAALNSIDAIQADLGADTPDTDAALQELINLPANMFNGFLNGATLNLDELIPLIGESDVIKLPEGVSIDHLSFAFGGLFSTGLVQNGVGDTAIGGSLFNAVGLDLSGLPSIANILGLNHIVGEGIGPMGALLGMQDILTGLINDLGDAS